MRSVAFSSCFRAWRPPLEAYSFGPCRFASGSARLPTQRRQNVASASAETFTSLRSLADRQRLRRLTKALDVARERPVARPRGPNRVPNEDGHWLCTVCNAYLLNSSFPDPSGGRSGTQSTCRRCTSEKRTQWRSSTRGYFMTLLGNARHNALRRMAAGRGTAGSFSIDLEFIFELLLHQEGRCAYSGIPISLTRYTHWQCSLERLNPVTGGYTPDNIALICSEFQTCTQWSWQKVLALPPLRARRICSVAEELAFHTTSISKLGMEENLLRYMRITLNIAQTAGRMRRMRGRSTAGVVDIVLNDLLELFHAQQGLCAYSSNTLKLHGTCAWQASLERVDNESGYINGNSVFICREFQSSDRSRRALHPHRIQGSAQWSEAKVDALLKWLDAPHVIDWIAAQQHRYDLTTNCFRKTRSGGSVGFQESGLAVNT